MIVGPVGQLMAVSDLPAAWRARASRWPRQMLTTKDLLGRHAALREGFTRINDTPGLVWGRGGTWCSSNALSQLGFKGGAHLGEL